MDNDVRNTEYCASATSAVAGPPTRSSVQRTTVGSAFGRIGLFPGFDHDTGYTALYRGRVS